MPVISHQARLVYFDIPKVACTSLKSLFYEIETGEPLVDAARLSRLGWWRRRLMQRAGLPQRPVSTALHALPGYRTWSHRRSLAELDIPDGYARVVVLRDPAARLHSAWSNKASPGVFASRDETEDLANEGLPAAPDFSTYLRHLDRYRMVSRPVWIHTQPYSWHLGPDLAAYDRVFRLEEIDLFRDWLSERLGRSIALPRSNRTETEPRAVPLDAADLDRLRALTAADYDWLGGLYDREAGLSRLAARLGATAVSGPAGATGTG